MCQPLCQALYLTRKVAFLITMQLHVLLKATRWPGAQSQMDPCRPDGGNLGNEGKYSRLPNGAAGRLSARPGETCPKKGPWPERASPGGRRPRFRSLHHLYLRGKVEMVRWPKRWNSQTPFRQETPSAATCQALSQGAGTTRNKTDSVSALVEPGVREGGSWGTNRDSES